MDVLSFTEDDVCRIRKFYEIDPRSIKQSVEILKSWIQKQKHLPQDTDENFLEKCLLRNKFRIEQAKIKLEGYYTLRGMYREDYLRECNRDIVPSKEVAYIVPIPKLTPKQERVICIKFANPDPEVYDLPHVIRFSALLFEILIRRDYSQGEIFVLDCEGATIEHMKKFSPTEITRIFTIYQGAYSGHLTSLNFVNAPGYLSIIMAILKMALPPKIFSKIKVHNDCESLHKSCPQECLPRDYGGELDSMENLQEKWDKVFEDNQKFFSEIYYKVSDEDQRIGDVKKNEVFGVNGSFKQLALD